MKTFKWWNLWFLKNKNHIPVGYGLIDGILVHAMADFFLVLASLTWTDKSV